MRNSKPGPVMVQSIETHTRLDMAIDALDAVAVFCAETYSSVGADGTLPVNADHFASLLSLIVAEMRAAHEEAEVRSDVQ